MPPPLAACSSTLRRLHPAPSRRNGFFPRGHKGLHRGTVLPQNQGKSARLTNVTERPHARLKRQIKTVLPSAETAAMRFWSLLALGQVSMHKVDGWYRASESHQP
jgi:hypothetical protein